MLKPINIDDEAGKATLRRLVLSKRVYLHGLEHSNYCSDLDKMIAVHNFHNAIEIILRAILLHYEIKIEKTLNITFENMIKEINDSLDIKLPYTQQIRFLNNDRNGVQHKAFEPETAMMEEWRVFLKKFLEEAYIKYFGVSFDEVSSIDFVSDNELRSMLSEASHKLSKSGWKEVILQSKTAFIHAFKSISNNISLKFSHPSLKTLIKRRPSILTGGSSEFIKVLEWQFEKIDDAFENLIKDTKNNLIYTVALSTGINISQLKKFYDIPPMVVLNLGGLPVAFGQEGPNSEDDAKWIFDFVLESIIKWQSMGLEPKVASQRGL